MAALALTACTTAAGLTFHGMVKPCSSHARRKVAGSSLQSALAQPGLIGSMAQVGMEVQSSTPRADAEEWR
ncbi:MAG: hypothetical protein ABIR76_14320, partial [Polaromonas sp.]